MEESSDNIDDYIFNMYDVFKFYFKNRSKTENKIYF
jgi:hypothetical protein